MPNLLRIPAPLDPHVHLRGMAWAHKGNFASETAAALAGGYTCICDMPNTPPETISRAALDSKLAALSAEALCDWGVYYGASAEDNTVSFPEVIDQVCGLKMFCNETTGNLLIEDPATRAAHFQAWPRQRPIAVHAEGQTVAEILMLVRQTRQRTHFLHISTAEEIDLLRVAKADGLPVTIGVCPHHLWLTVDDLPALGAFGHMKPGLKTRTDRDALWQALTDGLIDCVESDHAPHTREEKQRPIAPYGVPGLETTLPLLFTAVQQGRLTAERAVALVSSGPRGLWNMPAPADTYAEIDLDADFVLSDADLHTACGWSPFSGMRLNARVVRTVVRGVTAFENGQIRVSPGFGRNAYAV
jgi:carbamoyl-phosphate synthase/aspartate carbamoyltransferase/dihydroorotase